MRILFALCFASLAQAAITCPTGSTVLTSIGAGGNASVAATWGGSAIGDGNGKCLIATGPVVIDQDLGTNAGAGLKGAITQGSGSYSINTSAARHIYFGSTGSDPCGSGSETSPASDATMFGFFLPAGDNLIVGTQANRVTITSADGVSPWYIAATSGNANITVKWASLSHLGASSACGGNTFFAGVTHFVGAGTVDLENLLFTSPYAAFFGSGAVALTIKNILITGRTSAASFSAASGGITSVVSQDITEYLPATNGYRENWNALASYSGANNAIAGTSSVIAGNLLLGSVTAVPTISSTLTYNDPAQTSTYGFQCMGSSTPASIISGNYAEGCGQAVYADHPVTVSGNVFAADRGYTTGQGMIFDVSTALTATNNLCVMRLTATQADQSSCFFVYGAGASATITNNTVAQLLTGGEHSNGIFLGDQGTDSLDPLLVDYNLVTGFYRAVWDSTTMTPDVYVQDYASVGIHHNATVATVPYHYDLLPDNWETGCGTHPSFACYGDVDSIDPAFIDSSRASLAEYDRRALGSGGTAADLFTKLGYRSGWGGTYTLSATPVADIITWTRFGFTPGDSRVCPSGVTYGAIACITAATAMRPTQ